MKKLSYFKRVKNNTYFLLTNLSEPIKKKALVEEYIAMTERVANHNNMPFEHDPDKLYANVTQAIFHLKKKGLVESPSRSMYTAVAGDYAITKDTPYETFVLHGQPLSTLLERGLTKTPVETPAEEVVETPAEEVVETPAEEAVETPAEEAVEEAVETPAEEAVETPAEEVSLDEILEDSFYMDEIEVVDVDPSDYEFERLDLQVTTKKGGVLIGCFSVARGDDFLLIRNGEKTVVVPMTDIISEDHPRAVVDFLTKACEDFQHAPSASYAAERVCQVLLVCQDAHGHPNPLDGLVTYCDGYCPVNEVWFGFAKEVAHV